MLPSDNNSKDPYRRLDEICRKHASDKWRTSAPAPEESTSAEQATPLTPLPEKEFATAMEAADPLQERDDALRKIIAELPPKPMPVNQAYIPKPKRNLFNRVAPPKAAAPIPKPQDGQEINPPASYSEEIGANAEWKSIKRFFLLALGTVFCAVVFYTCNQPSPPLFGYIPADVYRMRDGKVFKALAKVKAYKHYEEDIASFGPKSGEWRVDQLAGYRFDVSAIVLRNGRKYPLSFESEETPYAYNFDALVVEPKYEDSEWSITLVPATQENVNFYKPKVGNWPVLFLE